MDYSIKDILESYVHKKPAELVDIAIRNYTVLVTEFVNKFGTQNAVNALFSLVLTTVSADGNLTELEWLFVRRIFQIDTPYEQMLEIARGFATDEVFCNVDDFFDSLPVGLGKNMLELCACVCAADLAITDEEVKRIETLIEE